jgi:hypothetical protein
VQGTDATTIAGVMAGFEILARGRTLGACAVAVLLCGCSGSGAHKRKHPIPSATAQPVCAHEARSAMARLLAVPRAAIADASSTGNNGMPQCSFSARVAGGSRVEVRANVDNTPQPYFVLERTIVEASQIFGARRLSPAPVAVTRLGLGASWFPAEQWLMATDGYRLITTSVSWRGAKQSRKIALAENVTRPYLHTPHGKVAQALADGFPSG